ncbi:hypothetical protein MTO96_025684, partial [Rhipicephalus appendiculatus]
MMTSVGDFRGSPVAVIATRDTNILLSNVHLNLTIPTTLWTCQHLNSRCYQSFLRYITQSVAFPRPGFVFAPWPRGLSKGILGEVRRLDVSHPYVYWVFAVREHSDVDATLSSHSCQVVTVSENDIRIAANGYKSCSKRVTSSSFAWKTLLDSPESERYYARNQNFDYVFSYQKIPYKCTVMGPLAYMNLASGLTKIRHPEGAALLDAYNAINTTVLLQCPDTSFGETLLREKRIDFLLFGWFGKKSTFMYEYRYALFLPSSFCFYSRSRVPIPPSFSGSWIFFSWCLVCLSPFCFAIIFVIRAQSTIRPSERVALSTVIMVLVSSFLGRSPQGLNVSASATRLAIAAWLLAMFFIGNYLQSSVTASRSVPVFSAEIRTEEDMLKHLHEGTLVPCVTMYLPQLRKQENFQAFYKPLANVLADHKCQSSCIGNYGFGCMEKARRGTHIYFSTCRETELRLAFKYALMVGEDTLGTSMTHSAVHIRFPFRHQHRRLLMAISESGIWMRSTSSEQFPPVEHVVMSFDMPLQDYLTILYTGIVLSLVALTLEMLTYRYLGQ